MRFPHPIAFVPEHVEAALQKISRLQPSRSKSPGKVYCVMPAKGGCGASTLASNFAHQLTRVRPTSAYYWQTSIPWQEPYRFC